MQRIVLDSSIWVRGAISKTGSSGYIIQSWREGAIEVVVSREILAETYEVLLRSHIQKKRHLTHAQKRRVVTVMAKYGLLVRPTVKVDAVADDPDDNVVIATAIAGNATIIVSGDEHLLALREYQGIRIIDAPTFARFLRTTRSH